MICFVTDRRRASDPSCAHLLDRINAAATAGVDVIQIRERDLPDRDLMALVGSALDLVRGTAARVLVNDRVDIALAAGAAGVHLRHDSADPARVRAIVPGRFLIGRSIHDPREAATARDCDFLLFGTVFTSAGKPAGHRVAGLDALRAACAKSRVPVLAIGGIDETNVQAVADAGAAGIAAAGIFMADRQVSALVSTVRAIRAAFDS
ncbi:MAG: thiamine phosphate synthase [Acidobacteria bacterium]|nr:MAG: thiamine phosphate synthase [Acidobacteriota bacterium]